MSILSYLSEHPASVNQTYWEHLQDALFFSFTAGKISIFLFIHALLPFLFTDTGSTLLDQLHQKMMAKKNLKTQQKSLITLNDKPVNSKCMANNEPIDTFEQPPKSESEGESK